MEIATNAVFAALLLQASTFVEKLHLPIKTPLESSAVTRFHLRARMSSGGPELDCVLHYAGGFKFLHSHGVIDSFDTSDSYLRVQDPRELENLVGDSRYTEAECLAKARSAIESLGYTNVPLIQKVPEVETPEYKSKDGRGVPRHVFKWRKDDGGIPASIEVDSGDLSLKHIFLIGPPFWGKPWPATFGTTNVYDEPDPCEPKRPDLLVSDVSREYALAFIRAILPEVSNFCAKLGGSIPQHVRETDIVMGASEVSLTRGRLTASLQLTSGHTVVFYAGHIWAVVACDAYLTNPGHRKKVRESREYRDPVRFSKEELVAKVRQIAIEGLGLPPKQLYLDTEPIFSIIANPSGTNGLRRCSFHWEAPATEAERKQRMSRRELPEEISISAEVDAVSGDIKVINFLHRFLEKPDPEIQLPK